MDCAGISKGGGWIQARHGVAYWIFPIAQVQPETDLPKDYEALLEIPEEL